MDISDLKSYVSKIPDYFNLTKLFISEYIFTRLVLNLAIASIFASLFLVLNATPKFYISATLLTTNTKPTTGYKAEGIGAILLGAGLDGAQKNTMFISAIDASPVSKELWEKWGIRFFNSDPKNTDPYKMPRSHSLTDRIGSFMLGYNLEKYYTYVDLQEFIQSTVEIKTDYIEYEMKVDMYYRNKDVGLEFIDDLIMAADRVSKNIEIQKSKSLIATLTKDLRSVKNSSIAAAFAEKINSEHYAIAYLSNELPYWVFYMNPPHASTYPVSPNISAIFFSNFIIFIFLGTFSGFYSKNKEELW